MKHSSLYIRIKRLLLNPKWLKKNNIDKSIITKTLNNDTFLDTIEHVQTHHTYTCEHALTLCKPMMEHLTDDTPPDNWLEYIFNYVLHKAFPDAVTIELKDSLNVCCELYIKILRIFCEYEKENSTDTFVHKYPINFLNEGEILSLEDPSEYRKFVKMFNHDCIYELLKLSKSVQGFNTLDHISGVHYLSMFIAHQLSNLGINIDLGRVSGAGAGHDIGKYGCKAHELKRVPHLHYYYTDVWFKKHNINYIRNIAINHSTWDLELEDLSLESLILIYADFRVKNKITPTSRGMHIFTLKDSFQVILDKLENMNPEKETRYKRVYAKLLDFENYLISLGVNTNPDEPQITAPKSENKPFSLMYGDDIIDNLRHLSIEHNIEVMYLFRNEASLDRILDKARNETDWKTLKEYIRLFAEYSTYLTQSQKLRLMEFLYDTMLHPEDDVRYESANLLGVIVALYDEDYRKELPTNVHIESSDISTATLFDNYLNLMINKRLTLLPLHNSWIGNNIAFFVHNVFSRSNTEKKLELRHILAKYYLPSKQYTQDTQIYLLRILKYTFLDYYNEDVDTFIDFALECLNKKSPTLRISVLFLIDSVFLNIPEESNFTEKIKVHLIDTTNKHKVLVENYLRYKLAKKLSLTDQENFYKEILNIAPKNLSEIYLSNLKTATHWSIKKAQIRYLSEYLPSTGGDTFNAALHFCNVLKVSQVPTVRNQAGESILQLMHTLNAFQRNEVAVELLRALEMEGQRFTEYIPDYLGRIMLWLEPAELDEIIRDLSYKIKTSKSNLKTLIAKTLGVIISYYPSYYVRFSEDSNVLAKRYTTLLGILLNGFADYDLKVVQSSISVLGKDVFDSPNLNLMQKKLLFEAIAKKLLTLLGNFKNDNIMTLSNAAMLNHIYSFISDYDFFIEKLTLPVPKKIAFFPGTFDPFSISHKQIAKEISDKGFDVYLAVDEFSWSKKTLPNLIRRKVISMSIADELNLFLFPSNIQVNIANNNDLKSLRDAFPHSATYIAVGSDVVLNASSYKNVVTENSIQTFPHIVFNRFNNSALNAALKQIQAETVLLTLGTKYQEVSSTKIRECIDNNRDISELIDPLAESFIYKNGFYQRQPSEKMSLVPLKVKSEVLTSVDSDTILKIKELFKTDEDKLIIDTHLSDLSNKTSPRILILRDFQENIVGFSTFHWLRTRNLYSELNDDATCTYIRYETKGRIACINAMCVKDSYTHLIHPLEQLLITETIAFLLERDYECTIFRPSNPILTSYAIKNTLELQGFKSIPTSASSAETLAVNMNNPCILSLDIGEFIKEPYKSNVNVLKSIKSTRDTLRKTLVNMYPGTLILSFDNHMIQQSLIDLVCKENNVPNKVITPRALGKYMCVPYGRILDKYVVPNTVTKSLHTEKVFDTDASKFRITEFPHYLNMDNQVTMLNSFNRDIILVDNLLHKGYRIQALDPRLNEKNIHIRKVIVGILSGHGKDLMDKQNRDVSSVYFIPRLKYWFNESSFYPYIGGDGMWNNKYPERNLLPSVNLILPYTYPHFMRDVSYKHVTDLSTTALNNALDILQTLESEHVKLHGKSLTLSNVGQVLNRPRIPYKGSSIDYDLSKSPSFYIENDIEVLGKITPNIF